MNWMKKLLVLVLLFLLGSYTTIEAKAECISGNCKNGKGKATYSKGTYEGNFKDGSFDGDGTFTWTNGDTYTGSFKEGDPDGIGEYVWKEDGRRYKGMYIKGQPNGYGKLFYPDGRSYEGKFANGKPSDTGKFADDTGVKKEPYLVNAEAAEVDSGGKNLKKTSFWKNLFGGSGKKDASGKSGSGKDGVASTTKYSFVKSVVMPGWTQWDNGEKVKGSVFFFSFWGSALALYATQNSYNTQKDKYNKETDMIWLYPSNPMLVAGGILNTRSLYNDYSKTGHRAENLSLLMAGIYVVNVVDAIFFSKPVASSAYIQGKDGFNFSSFINKTNDQRLENTYMINYTRRF
jgi:hypothetical protein